VKHRHTVRRVTAADERLQRIKHLEVQIARTRPNSSSHRTLRAAIRIETDAYRKSLDTEQATAKHDAKP
jgi:hypothetical protein